MMTVTGPLDAHRGALTGSWRCNHTVWLNVHVTRRFEAGALSIDMAAAGKARWNGEPIMLRPNEFRLLRFFAENPNRVLTRDDLISGLGKREPPIDERTVDVWIGRLRRAIKAAGGGNPLRTVRSIGYVFDLN